MHRGTVLNEEIFGECKKIFDNLHGAETAKVIKKLSAILLQKQVIIASHFVSAILLIDTTFINEFLEGPLCLLVGVQIIQIYAREQKHLTTSACIINM